MSKILIVAEHDGTKLNQSTAKCVTCATAIAGAEIVVAVLAADGAAVAAQAAQIKGVTKVLRADNPANAHALAATLAPQVAALAAGYSHVLGPSTTFGKDLMPRVAALLDALGVGACLQLDAFGAEEAAEMLEQFAWFDLFHGFGFAGQSIWHPTGADNYSGSECL